MAVQVLSKPGTYEEAIKQLRSLWGSWPFHFSDFPDSSRGAREMLEKTLFEFAQGDLDIARKWVHEHQKPWRGKHNLTVYMSDQDGCYSNGGESVEVDAEETRLIIQKGENDYGSVLTVALAPLGTKLRWIGLMETIRKLGEEPVPIVDLMIRFQDNRIVSFEEKRSWEMPKR